MDIVESCEDTDLIKVYQKKLKNVSGKTSFLFFLPRPTKLLMMVIRDLIIDDLKNICVESPLTDSEKAFLSEGAMIMMRAV